MKTKSCFLYFSIIAIFLITSCIPQKKILYLQDIPKEDTATHMKHEVKMDYKVQPGDNLYIQIFSLEAKAMEYFNRESTSTSNYYNDIGVYLNSYSVNDSGYIDFPLVGNIYVKNNTIEEIKQKMHTVINEYLTETTVIVKLVNFNISLLGEFKRPGQYKIYQDNINIFEAISMGGDLTDFAKRNKICLIRQTKDGSVIHRLDLNDKRILESDYYLLKPNDIVYAEPLKGKQFSFAEFPYALLFSTIATTLLIIAFFQK